MSKEQWIKVKEEILTGSVDEFIELFKKHFNDATHSRSATIEGLVDDLADKIVESGP